VTIQFRFEADISTDDQARIKTRIEEAFQEGEILSCPCPSVEVLVFETRPPDFQASISCACEVMRPLFSSSPDNDE
jgi:hypothetical protein